MRFLLGNNRSDFKSKYQAGLASQIYVPLNSGRYVGTDNTSNLFKNRPNTDSINLADWITNQITLGNITFTDANTNIYNTNGTIASNRTITVGGQLDFVADAFKVSIGDTTNTDTGTVLVVDSFNSLIELGDPGATSNGTYIQVDDASLALRFNTATAEIVVNGDENLINISLATLRTFADDTAAGVGGLSAGDLYKTAAGAVMIKL